jgi:hypothetical protein
VTFQPEPLETVLARLPVRLGGSAAKLRRAAKHLGELHEAITGLGVGDYYLIERDDQGAGATRWVFRQSKPLPDEWAVVVGEFAHNLRSALDIAVFQLAEASEGRPGNKTAFPIFSTERDYLAQRRNYLKGVPERHSPFFDQAQPFANTKSAFADLAWLTNEDQHRHLHARFVLNSEVDLEFVAVGDGTASAEQIEEVLVGAPGQVVRDGSVLASIRQRKELVTVRTARVRFDVAFGERQLGWAHFEEMGEAVTLTLEDLGNFFPA